MFDEVSNVTKQKKVSRVTVNSSTLEKPSLPDRPKNINDIKKILEIKNSPAHFRNIELMKPTFFRRPSKDTNAKVTTEQIPFGPLL